MGVQVLFGNASFGQSNVNALVAIPVFLGNCVGVMGMSKRYLGVHVSRVYSAAGSVLLVGPVHGVCTQPCICLPPLEISASLMTYCQRKGTLVGSFADVVPEVLCALIHDFFIVIKLVAATAWAGLENRAGVVVPFEAVVRFIPIDSPAKVTRVDVAGETLFVSMELVTHKVHLTCQSSMVALATKVVSVCGHLGVNLGGIVVGTNLHRKQTGDHAHPRRGAKGRRAVSRVELDGRGGQAVEVGGLDLGIRIVHLELRSGQLIGHDVKDVGPGSLAGAFGSIREHRSRQRVQVWSHCEGAQIGGRR